MTRQEEEKGRRRGRREERRKKPERGGRSQKPEAQKDSNIERGEKKIEERAREGVLWSILNRK